MLHFGSIKTKLSWLQTWRCLALFAFLNCYIYLKFKEYWILEDQGFKSQEAALKLFLFWALF